MVVRGIKGAFPCDCCPGLVVPFQDAKGAKWCESHEFAWCRGVRKVRNAYKASQFAPALRTPERYSCLLRNEADASRGLPDPPVALETLDRFPHPATGESLRVTDGAKVDA
jgi:hypothetical protein